jgi:hypothetical protein
MSDYGVKESQSEFFEEFNKGQQHSVSPGLPNRHSPAFHLSLEQSVLGITILLLGVIVVFYMGVWRGRVLERQVLSNPTIVKAMKAPKHEIPRVSGAVVQPLKVVPKPILPIAKNPDKPYTIQVITYRSKDRAKKELSDLLAKGFAPSLSARGEYFEVSVGQYTSRLDANRDINSLKMRYKDCYVKQI